MTRTNAMGSEYQSAMPHEGQFKRGGFTWGQIAILAYCIGITTGAIGASLWWSL